MQPDVYDWESAVYLNGNRNLVFPYIQAFAEIAKQHPGSNRILMIGGGTFTVPTYLANLNPTNKVDVVEIDSQLTSVSKNYFNFHQPHNLQIINADGRQILNNNSSRYNLIYLDAFSGGVPPFQLLTEQATKRVRDTLTSNGIVSVNIVAPIQGSGSNFAASILRTYKHVFSHAAVYSVQIGLNPFERQNLLLLASQSALPTYRNVNAGGNQNIQHMLQYPINFSNKGIVLTDNYAPVERLLATY